ncbi:Bacterial type II secretion system protein F domain protein [Gimesia maris]|uniref:type II secretion system F family protein n=1 Tax=Gimesia maris TaxID=122 RepID=UPI00118A3B5E|nr:type II secretion system F family protein [Gimesia maris]QDU16200.1 Bacterial type II secretion system protein F domain protein [Gimesia maris]
MQTIVIGILIFLPGIVMIIWMLRRANAAEISRQRLQGSLNYERSEYSQIQRSPIMRRWRWLVAVMFLAVTTVLWFLASWPWPYTISIGVIMGLILWQLEEWWLQRKINRVEQQLEDSIDMMVASVKSGASMQGALESAMENTSAPWKNELSDLIASIRYGDDPVLVLSELSSRIPVETIELFAQTLAVNWSVGGQLSLALANVAHTIRDRLELSRRMQAMTTQARLSVISVVLVSYFIGALMWRNDPERMVEFLNSLVGQAMVSIAMFLQAVGFVWISRLSTPRF